MVAREKSLLPMQNRRVGAGLVFEAIDLEGARTQELLQELLIQSGSSGANWFLAPCPARQNLFDEGSMSLFSRSFADRFGEKCVIPAID